MKKALLGTTALIAGGLIAGSVMAADLEPAPLPAPVDEGFEVTVGGNAFGGFFYLDQSGPGSLPNQALVPWTAEVHFTATTTLANGIQVGVRIELEGMSWNGITGGNTGVGGDQIDEHYIWLQGNFGRFEIGANDGASDALAVMPPSYGALGLNGPSFIAVGANSAPSGARKDFSGDSNKVTYFTPRISGFQAAVSFTPNTLDTGGAALPVNPGGASTVRKNVFSGAANYRNNFNDVSIAFGAGMETGKIQSGGRQTHWDVGASIGFAGFTIGGNYSRNKVTVTAPAKDRVWMVGASYGSGPWSVGVGYLNSKRTSTGDTFRNIGGGATYALGTGVNLTADIHHIKRVTAGVTNKGLLTGIGIATAF